MAGFGREQLAFAQGKLLRLVFQFLIGGLVVFEEGPIVGFGVPIVHGIEVKRMRNIAKELCATVVRVAPEELRPISRGAIDSFKHSFTSRLDFELPEDYKHRCPIFRSRILAFQDYFIRGSLVC